VSGITDKEINSIRKAQEEFLPERVIIRRKHWVGGDKDYEAQNLAVDVPARLTPGFGFWRQVADRFEGITPFTITVAWDQDIHPGDTVVDANANTYEIRAVQAPESYLTAIQTLGDLI
jgi:hypothetical protein